MTLHEAPRWTNRQAAENAFAALCCEGWECRLVAGEVSGSDLMMSVACVDEEDCCVGYPNDVIAAAETRLSPPSFRI